jgi:hypothetical protein
MDDTTFTALDVGLHTCSLLLLLLPNLQAPSSWQ